MSSTVTPSPTPSIPNATPASLAAALRRRLGEASTWAGLGGILLVMLNLLPAALPGFHAALGQHGWAKITGLVAALLSFAVAVARKEGDPTAAELASAAEIVIQAEKSRTAPAAAVEV